MLNSLGTVAQTVGERAPPRYRFFRGPEVKPVLVITQAPCAFWSWITRNSVALCRAPERGSEVRVSVTRATALSPRDDTAMDWMAKSTL